MLSLLLALAMAALPAVPADRWLIDGRPLPQPERRQVAPDRRLATYRACPLPRSGRATGSVTTILPDLFKRWARAFERSRPGMAVVSPAPYGPPQGRLSASLDAFLRGGSDFALLSRALTAEDKAALRAAQGMDPLVVPLANGSWRHFGFVDTVVVIVNARNPLRAVSLEQLGALLSAKPPAGQARPRKWSELGASGWNDRSIHIYGAATWAREDSARSAVLRQRALAGGAWRADLAASGDEGDAPARVAADPLGIAVTGLGHLPAGTRALAVSAGTGRPVAPTWRNIGLNRYPLSRTIDLVLRRQADGSPVPVAAEFARFVLSREGQAVVARQGVFVPLRARQAQAALALLGPCPAR